MLVVLLLKLKLVSQLSMLTSEALLLENKKCKDKMLPRGVLNLGPLPFKSDALLSELVSHLLFERSLTYAQYHYHYKKLSIPNSDQIFTVTTTLNLFGSTDVGHLSRYDNVKSTYFYQNPWRIDLH